MNLFNILKSLISGYLTGLVISIPLGPSAIESVNRTISSGFKEGFMVSIGAISADMTYLILINYGILNILQRQKKTEALFWLFSGIILLIITRKSYRNNDNKLQDISNNNKKISFLSGYMITLTNPMTLTLWLGLSGTALRAWQYVGKFYYYVFILSILFGMITWFFSLNLLALKGFKMLRNDHSKNVSKLMNISIYVLGIGFIIFGLIQFIKYI